MTNIKLPTLSFWEKETFFRTSDVVIVGSGIVGLWLAYHLKTQYPKITVKILERGPSPTGASTRNAGFACFGSVTEMISDLESMPEEDMLKVVEMRYKGIGMTRQIMGDDVIDYHQCGGYECLNIEHSEFQSFKNKVEFLNEKLEYITKERSTFNFCDHTKMNQFGFRGFTDLIENKLEGGLHSGKLVKSLIKKVTEMGVEIINGVNVSGLEELTSIVGILTDQDRPISICAKNVFICVNGFTNDLLPDAPIKPARGQMLITSPILDLPFNGTFHHNQGFNYFRNIGNRVMIGGARDIAIEEESTTDMVVSAKIQSELERLLQEHIVPGKKYTITDRWAGIMGFNYFRRPVVYHLSKDSRVHILHACNGMGVATAPVFTETVAEDFLQ